LNQWRIKISILARIALVFVLLGFIVLFLMDKLVMPLYTRHGQEIVVPDLQDMSQDVAKSTAKKQGYKFVIDKTVFDDYVAAGTVIEQIPPAGTVTKRGRVIKAIVSGGEKMIPMPRLIGISPQGAMTTASSLGLVIPRDSVQYKYSGQYPKGVVFEQSIPQDSLLHKGNTLSISVSLGALPTEFIVPKLLEQPLDRARQILLDAGLGVGTISYRATRQYPENTVLGQSIKSETAVSKGTAIDLLVAQKPGAKPDTTAQSKPTN
jgi:beta-lactam-binding protein with PASTA domain